MSQSGYLGGLVLAFKKYQESTLKRIKQLLAFKFTWTDDQTCDGLINFDHSGLKRCLCATCTADTTVFLFFAVL